jgi:hypothetical protein
VTGIIDLWHFEIELVANSRSYNPFFKISGDLSYPVLLQNSFSSRISPGIEKTGPQRLVARIPNNR